MDRYFLHTANRASALLYRFIKGVEGFFLLPANICPIVPLTFLAAGVKFRLVDINPNTLCIDENTCLKFLQDNRADCAGICFVRTYGFVYDTTSFFRKLHSMKDEFLIIDDRCLCTPELERTDAYGADMILFSTGYAKLLELGYGGYCFVKSRVLPLYTLYFSGIDIESLYKESFNKGEKLKEIPIGWLDLSALQEKDIEYFYKIEKYRDEILNHKKNINMVYMESLPQGIQLDANYQNWRFNIRLDKLCKRKIMTKLFEEHLFASSHYQPVGTLFGLEETFYMSDDIHATIINLFNDHYFTEEMALKTCKIINNIINQ